MFDSVTSGMVICVALLSVVSIAWARFRPRLTFRRTSQRIGRTHVFDGMVNVATRDESETFSGYVCYIRRAREKADQIPDAAL